MDIKQYTAAEFRAISTIKDGWYTVEADGSTVIVTVDAGDAGEYLRVKMTGSLAGNIKLVGDGRGDAFRDGAGDGNASRNGDGYGDAWRSGAGRGDAFRDGDL